MVAVVPGLAPGFRNGQKIRAGHQEALSVPRHVANQRFQAGTRPARAGPNAVIVEIV